MVPVTVSGILIIPSRLKLSLEDKVAYFDVTVPENFNAGEYYIQWQTLNETTIPIYSPLKKTLLQVTAVKNIRVDVGVLQEIPRGGISGEVYISTVYPPNEDIIITLTFSDVYPGIMLS